MQNLAFLTNYTATVCTSLNTLAELKQLIVSSAACSFKEEVGSAAMTQE